MLCLCVCLCVRVCVPMCVCVCVLCDYIWLINVFFANTLLYSSVISHLYAFS